MSVCIAAFISPFVQFIPVFFHLPVPEAALLKVIYHISLVSMQCSCVSSVTDAPGLTGSEINSGVCVSGNVLSFKSYLAARHKFLSVVFFYTVPYGSVLESLPLYIPLYTICQ